MSKTVINPQADYIIERMEGSADANPSDDGALRRSGKAKQVVKFEWGDETDDDFNPLDRANYNNSETDEITRLEGQIRLLTAALEHATSYQCGQGEALADKLLLDDIRAEFRAVYEKVPPVFQGQWYRVAKLLGVIK